jgi:thiamine-phosphate pyrophosphorylase
LFVTDPGRTPDPASIAQRLPRGAGVVFRTFGSRDAPDVAAALKRVADARGLTLLIGFDPDLAEKIGADGVHVPEFHHAKAKALRKKHPDWLFTGAAHGEDGLRTAEKAGLDAVLLSSVFPSRSVSAGPSLGPGHFAQLVGSTTVKVYALGGVDALTAPLLIGSGAVGVAAVEGVLSAYPA